MNNTTESNIEAKCTKTTGWINAQLKSREFSNTEKRKRIDAYNMRPSTCTYCHVDLVYESRNNKFCSKSCAASHNNHGINRHRNQGVVCKSDIVPVTVSRPAGRIANVNLCGYCNSVIDSPKLHCNLTCVAAHKTKLIVDAWLINPSDMLSLSRTIRTHLIKTAGSKCSLCGWGKENPHTHTLPLVIDHIDGNAENNHPDNLRVLCPNCDSLTPTYKGANRGNGRANRRQRYRDGKSY